MPFRFRKSFKIARGVRVNLGKRGASLSVGRRRARVSQSTRGRRTTSISGPRGSGLGYSTSRKAGCLVVVLCVSAMWRVLAQATGVPMAKQHAKPVNAGYVRNGRQ